MLLKLFNVFQCLFEIFLRVPARTELMSRVAFWGGVRIHMPHFRAWPAGSHVVHQFFWRVLTTSKCVLIMATRNMPDPAIANAAESKVFKSVKLVTRKIRSMGSEVFPALRCRSLVDTMKTTLPPWVSFQANWPRPTSTVFRLSATSGKRTI